MNNYADDNVVVHSSPLEGLGVFTKRPFKKGEPVLVWNPQRLSVEECAALLADQRRYLNTLENGTQVLMQIPERFVNSSSEPNTKVEHNRDVAIRDIVVGEEITSCYPL